MADDAELDALLVRETDRVEWKESSRQDEEILRAVCALANDYGGSGAPGFVVIGLSPEGRVVGADVIRDSLDEQPQKLVNRLRSTKIREWRQDWMVVRARHLTGRTQASLPLHGFRPIGYVIQQHLARKDQAVKGYARWSELIPRVFRELVLEQPLHDASLDIEHDEHCLAQIRHFASLVPLAQAARKPMFDLRQADGIGGGQIQAVARCRKVFEDLVRVLLERLLEKAA